MGLAKLREDVAVEVGTGREAVVAEDGAAFTWCEVVEVEGVGGDVLDGSGRNVCDHVPLDLSLEALDRGLG